MSEVNHIFAAIALDDAHATERFLSLVYDESRKPAAYPLASNSTRRLLFYRPRHRMV
jgi:hypothetical protein